MDGIYACITTPKLTDPFSLKEKENTMLCSTYTTWILKLEIYIAVFPAVAELVQASIAKWGTEPYFHVL